MAGGVFKIRSAVGTVVWCLLLAPIFTACPSKEVTAAKSSPASSIWVTGDSAPLTPSSTTRLREGGIESFFVEVGRLVSGTPESGPHVEIPTSNRVTLVLSGDLRAREAAQVSSISALLVDKAAVYQGAGALVDGFHLDFGTESSIEEALLLVRALRVELPPGFNLSLTIPVHWLNQRQLLQEHREDFDFAVAFLYGQRPGEGEDLERWNLAKIEEAARTIDALDIPFQLGLISLGWVTQDRERQFTTKSSLAELARFNALKLKSGFVLENSSRRVYEFVVQDTLHFQNWALRRQETLRAVRLDQNQVEEFVRLTHIWKLVNQIGLSFYRIPGETELLSMNSDRIVSSVLSEAAELQTEVIPEIQRRTGRGHLMRFTLVNSGKIGTDLSFSETNFCEITFSNATIADGDAGDFHRYDLLRAEADDRPQRTFRESNVLRLYAPVLEPGQRYTSGNFELIGTASPEYSISGDFIMPGGKRAEVPKLHFKGTKASN